ncbi:LOW QUALITY PROTEIN: lysine-specific demethylase 5B-B [Neosynchiropus ocellatus]
MNLPRPDEFQPPPECPVFEPSWEEFGDPYAFINKIRPIAEKTGICKVRPPPGWQPPFACDVDKLHFVPRIQRLNELEAQTRVKLNFLDQIAKFWDLQGCALKIPLVERKILDLYKLNKLVTEEGGFELVCRERRWTKIAVQMGFAPGKAIGSHLRGHYEKVLYPYHLFQTGANLLAPEADPELEKCVQKHGQTPQNLVQKEEHVEPLESTETPETVAEDAEQKPALERSVQTPEPSPGADVSPVASSGARRVKRVKSELVSVKIEPEDPSENRPNLRRRMGSLVAKVEPGQNPEPEKESLIPVKQEPVEVKEPVMEVKPRSKKPLPSASPSPVDLVVCLVCSSGGDEDRLLLCDGCDDSYHTFCLIPPLHDVPKGDWRCPKCLAQECSKPHEAFGFEQAYRDYSLRAFGQMADAFKSDYFNMPVHMVPTELVEKEFWRLVGAIEEDVTVEYGADIASKEFGSGFPIPNGRFKVSPEDEKYLKCGWNLNNLAMMNPSVLTHVTADICGMTLPWLYVGMCFSSFCWHIEDHWSYSINYLHWGEPKTWYGAPGFAAEQLEEVMRKLAPELFESQPDLLHQLVTIMNPNTLMAHGVPIYRTNQCAGEFVVTFPRAYHSGFNQGFNFAEAVNFCTVDWMPLGRQCVDHYRLLHRYNVFSHDEMVCNMASKAETLDVVLASAVHKDMAMMIREEKEQRDQVKKLGLLLSKEAQYDHLQDDERQCIKCRTTCYLSAVTCPCSPGVLVCLHHVDSLCSCPISNYTLNYRYTIDELYPMMNAVKQRAGKYDTWAALVTETLEAKLEKKRGLPAFRSLLSESESNNFPENDLLRRLRLVTQDAEKCATVAQKLLTGSPHTRFRVGSGRSRSQLTVEELSSFVRQLYNLCCSLPQAPRLKEMLNRVEDFQQHSEKVLADVEPSVTEIQSLLDVSFQLDVELPELPRLRVRLEQARWLEGVKSARAQPATLTLEAIRRFIDQGVGLEPHPSVEREVARLQELLTVSEHWEERASSLLKSRPPHSMETLSVAAEKASSIPAHLPNCHLLRDAVRKAHDWLQEVEGLQAGGGSLMLNQLSDAVLRGQAIPVVLEPLERLESSLAEVNKWRTSLAALFLHKDSSLNLLEVLCPRSDLDQDSSVRRKKKAKKNSRQKVVCDIEKSLSESPDPSSAASVLEQLRLRELEAVSQVRAANESKLLPSAACSELRVCVCQKAPMGAMLQCELCRDAFHSVCVRDASDPLDPQPWLCPLCRAHQKPALSEVLPLVEQLQRLAVRLPEGDALHFLVERTARWQHQAQVASQLCSLPLLEERAGPRGAIWPRRAGLRPFRTESRGPRSDPRNMCFLLQNISPEWTQNRNQNVFYTEHRCLPLQNLSPDLEHLMVEGLLLPVSLPEVQNMFHALLDWTSSQESNKYGDQPPQGDSQGHEAADAGGRDPAVTALEAAGQDASTLSSSEKKTKRQLERLNVDQNHKRQKRSQKLQRSSSPRSDFSQSEDSDEDMAACPADRCLLPEGDEVNWVQCDGSCNQWFHQVCVGVSSQRAETEDYICATCSRNNGPKRK